MRIGNLPHLQLDRSLTWIDNTQPAIASLLEFFTPTVLESE